MRHSDKSNGFQWFSDNQACLAFFVAIISIFWRIVRWSIEFSILIWNGLIWFHLVDKKTANHLDSIYPFISQLGCHEEIRFCLFDRSQNQPNIWVQIIHWYPKYCLEMKVISGLLIFNFIFHDPIIFISLRMIGTIHT